MKPATVETLVWVLIYGGLLAVCLGVFLRGDVAALGWLAIVGGALAAAAGAGLVWVRSRMKT